MENKSFIKFFWKKFTNTLTFFNETNGSGKRKNSLPYFSFLTNFLHKMCDLKYQILLQKQLRFDLQIEIRSARLSSFASLTEASMQANVASCSRSNLF